MNKLLIAVVAAASLSACGVAEKLKAVTTNGHLDAGKVSAQGYTLAKNLQDIQSLSGGLNGLVPSLDTSVCATSARSRRGRAGATSRSPAISTPSCAASIRTMKLARSNEARSRDAAAFGFFLRTRRN